MLYVISTYAGGSSGSIVVVSLPTISLALYQGHGGLQIQGEAKISTYIFLKTNWRSYLLTWEVPRLQPSSFYYRLYNSHYTIDIPLWLCTKFREKYKLMSTILNWTYTGGFSGSIVVVSFPTTSLALYQGHPSMVVGRFSITSGWVI